MFVSLGPGIEVFSFYSQAMFHNTNSRSFKLQQFESTNHAIFPITYESSTM